MLILLPYIIPLGLRILEKKVKFCYNNLKTGVQFVISTLSSPVCLSVLCGVVTVSFLKVLPKVVYDTLRHLDPQIVFCK